MFPAPSGSVKIFSLSLASYNLNMIFLRGGGGGVSVWSLAFILLLVVSDSEICHSLFHWFEKVLSHYCFKDIFTFSSLFWYSHYKHVTCFDIISQFLDDLFFFPFIFISWRLIALQCCSGFCHTLTWISHGFTCIPHPHPPSHLPLHPTSHLPPHPIPLGPPSAPALSTCVMHPTWAGDLFHPW